MLFGSESDCWSSGRELDPSPASHFGGDWSRSFSSFRYYKKLVRYSILEDCSKILRGILLERQTVCQNVGPHLSPNCLQKLSADGTSRQRVKQKQWNMNVVHVIFELDDGHTCDKIVQWSMVILEKKVHYTISHDVQGQRWYRWYKILIPCLFTCT